MPVIWEHHKWKSPKTGEMKRHIYMHPGALFSIVAIVIILILVLTSMGDCAVLDTF